MQIGLRKGTVVTNWERWNIQFRSKNVKYSAFRRCTAFTHNVLKIACVKVVELYLRIENWLPTINEKCIHLTCCVLINFNQNQLIICKCFHCALCVYTVEATHLSYYVLQKIQCKIRFSLQSHTIYQQTRNEFVGTMPDQKKFSNGLMVWTVVGLLCSLSENREWELENSVRYKKMIKFCIFNVSLFFPRFVHSSHSLGLIVLFSSIPVRD